MRTFDRALRDGRSIRVCTTDRTDGDFAIGRVGPELDARRGRIVDRPWIWMAQVHGAICLDLDAADVTPATVGMAADAAVTSSDAVAICVQTADCLPVVLWSDDGLIAAVHVGWRGLEAGVLDAATHVMGRRTRAPIHAFLGPSIGPECYEFGEVDGRRLVQRFGPSIMGTTESGALALDVRSAARSELVGRGVLIEIDDARCTACTDDFFSHRARNEDGRQTTVAWIEGP